MASSSDTSTRATVVIVGAGAAGIFTAYQIATQHPGTFDVRIFEAAPAIGGNVSSVTVEYGGQTYVIDAGAEFYYPNPQPHVQLLQQLPYMELPVVLQQNGSCWMPSDQTYWEPVNTVVNTPGQTITFSAWLGALRPRYGSGQQFPVFKSLSAPRLDPASCSSAFYSHAHNVLLPTTTFMRLRRQLLADYQGQNGRFFAGGWTTWFDSQEAALLAALDVVGRLSSPAAASAPFRPVGFDCAALPVRVKTWLEMVLSRKTERHRSTLVELIARLP